MTDSSCLLNPKRPLSRSSLLLSQSQLPPHMSHCGCGRHLQTRRMAARPSTSTLSSVVFYASTSGRGSSSSGTACTDSSLMAAKGAFLLVRRVCRDVGWRTKTASLCGADDMGLGKSLQSVALMLTVLQQGMHGRPTARYVLNTLTFSNAEHVRNFLAGASLLCVQQVWYRTGRRRFLNGSAHA